MPRLIDADVLFDKVLDLYRNGKKGVERKSFSTALDAVSDSPTVDAELVRHGWWNMEKDGYRYMMVCSECSEGYLGMPETNYCPNCGAKMDKGVTK